MTEYEPTKYKQMPHQKHSKSFPRALFPTSKSCIIMTPDDVSDELQRARATTKKIETPADVDGFPELNDPEKQEIKDLIKECVTSKPPPKTKKAVRTTPTGDTSGQSLYNTDSVHVHCSKLIFYCRPNSFVLAGSSAG